MKFGVIIVTYNRLALLKECVSCVLAQTEPFSNVCIIDNHSSDGTAGWLKTLPASVQAETGSCTGPFLISAVWRKIWEVQEALPVE